MTQPSFGDSEDINLTEYPHKTDGVYIYSEKSEQPTQK